MTNDEIKERIISVLARAEGMAQSAEDLYNIARGYEALLWADPDAKGDAA